MTPHASTGAWAQAASAHRRVRTFKRTAQRTAKGAALGVLALALAQYLAGYLFLWSLRAPVGQASPLTIARYAYYYGDEEPIRFRLLMSSAAGAGLVLLTGIAFVLPRPRALHGAARFARRGEIASAGLLGEEGLILGHVGGMGSRGGRYLRLPGQQGVSLSAQPRGGKGVGVVIPNLLSWPGSVVCVDIKRENWTVTAGHRARTGQHVHLFDPLSPDGRTARWNPLDYVDERAHQRVSDVQLIANMFFPDPPNTDPFWMASARSLFLGIALYLFATPSLPRTIGEILRQGMANDEEGFSAHWRRVVQGRMSGRFPLPEQCVRALYDVIDLAPQTASSIRKTFTSRLELWANPVLDAATSASDFDLRALRRTPTSIYLGVNPKDLHRLQPLMSLFFQQAIALQTDTLPEHDPTLAHQVLMLLDEFPALGRIPILATASGYLPGYNVRTLMVMQTPAQLREIYGENGARILLKTLAGRIFFAPKDMEDAEEVSRELGFTTVKVRSISKPLFEFGNRGRRGRSVSVSEQRRALLLPQEVRDMGARRQIVFAEDVPPILCKKIRYYAMPALRRRVRPPPTVPPIALLTPARTPAPSADPFLPAESTPRTREATLQDIEHLEALTLEDFAADFDQVLMPEKAEGERLTEGELAQAVESFLATLQQQR